MMRQQRDVRARRRVLWIALAGLTLWVGCGEDQASDEEPGGLISPAPSDKTDATETQRAFLENYEEVREEAALMSPESFRLRYAAPARVETLPYDATEAAFMPEIDRFTSMNDDQRGVLKRNGFVVLDHASYRTPEIAYEELYMGDLPVMITSDSILYALHRSYDSILLQMELTVMVGELDQLLAKMHGALGEALAASEVPTSLDQSAQDVDLYLAVARSLLSGERVATIGGGEAEVQLDKILANVESRQPAALSLFGTQFSYDYSQMTPRGHYTQDEILERYFQTMIWLGRTEMRMVEFPNGKTVFHRGAFEAAFMMHTLMDQGGAREHWTRLNTVIELMVGEKDSMDTEDMLAFAAAEGVDSLESLAATSDEALRDGLLASPYGIQRIMSQIMVSDPNAPTLVLPRSFLLMGQRFVIDSYVFHHVTYDRLKNLKTGEKIKRMLPSELDMQFALGSNVAGELLSDELERYGYQGTLHEVRHLVESHPAEFWESNLYNGRLHAARALDDPEARAQQPASMRTKAWDYKTLNTQLAAWAELRHDTILYAKQSYSSGVSCVYPDAYVEPEPLFFQRMVALAEQGQVMSERLKVEGFETQRVLNYFENMAGVMETLAVIARKELDGDALTDAEFAFLQGTIEKELVGCGEENYDGWYATLFFNSDDIAKFRPIIADVHTAPTDDVGNPTGWVLHGATGYARLMVFTMEDCEGAKAYVGPVSTYHSVLTENFERQTNEGWLDDLNMGGEQTTPTWSDEFKR